MMMIKPLTIELIKQLEQTRNETLDYYDLTESQLQKNYAPGKWTVRQILIHLSDAECVLLERIKRIIAEPGQVIWAFDQDKWNDRIDYLQYPMKLSKQLYTAARNSNIYLVEKFYSSLGDNEFVHSETGMRKLKNEFDKIADHNQSHLNQIEKALSQ